MKRTLETKEQNEGVIRFSFEQKKSQQAVNPELIDELNAWRHILFCLKLIGGRLDRYQGLGFGNISARESSPYSKNFIITGSQTGHFPNLKSGQYVRIEKADLQNFRLVANGDCPPSSESFTHAALYQADPKINYIFHVHSPDLFAYSNSLLCIDRDIPYGTPEMMSAVRNLSEENSVRPLIFATLGHEDGIFVAGNRINEVGSVLLTTYAQALKRNPL